MFILENTAFDPVITHQAGESIDPTGYIILTFICIILAAFLCAIFFEVNKKFKWLVVVSFVITVTVFVFNLFTLIQIQNENLKNLTDSRITYNIEGTQEWAEDTYLVKLTKSQAESLIKNRTDKDEFVSDSSVLAKYYGEDVFVKLVNINNEWVLFMNDKRMLRTDK